MKLPVPVRGGFGISMDKDAFHSLHNLSDSGMFDVALFASCNLVPHFPFFKIYLESSVATKIQVFSWLEVN